MSNATNLSSFIWSVADLLRGSYRQSDYGKVILPFTVLHRLDCILEPTKDRVLEEFKKCTSELTKLSVNLIYDSLVVKKPYFFEWGLGYYERYQELKMLFMLTTLKLQIVDGIKNFHHDLHCKSDKKNFVLKACKP
jgi:type I restriction-modification system DNA methylase subunit